MYIDAVAQTMHASSYAEGPGVPLPRTANCVDDNRPWYVRNAEAFQKVYATFAPEE